MKRAVKMKKQEPLPMILGDEFKLKKDEAAIIFNKKRTCQLITPQTVGEVSEGVIVATAIATMLRDGNEMLLTAMHDQLDRMIMFVTGMHVGMETGTDKEPKKRRGRPSKKEK